jgi:hypothetical protein
MFDSINLMMQQWRSRMKKANIGSSFDSWLREEGIYEEVSANPIKRLSERDSLLVLSLLESPPAPNARLRAAIKAMPKVKISGQ